MTLKKLLSASALVAIGMVLGRLLGLVREMFLAAHYGASSLADNAIILLITPDFITSALIGSTASAALIPAFSERTPAAARALFHQSLKVALAVFSGAALFLWAARSLTTWDIESSAWALTLLALPLSAATAILTAWLQFKGKFLIPAFATVIFNTVIIAGIVGLAPTLPMLATAIALAAAARLAAHIFATTLVPKTETPSPDWQIDAPLRSTYITAMLAGLLGLLPTYVPYALVAASGASVAIFNYALKLVLMPALLAQTIVQVALLPWLVAARKTRDAQSLATLHSHALQLCWLVSFFAALALCQCAPALAILFFAHGQMTEEATHAIATSVDYGIFAMPPLLITTLLQSILYAAGDARAPFTASLIQALCIVPLAIVGLKAGEVQGLLAAFALTQFLPIIHLYPACQKQGLLPAQARLKTGIQSTLSGLFIGIPIALWLSHNEFSPIVTIACAILGGGVSLGAALGLYAMIEKKPHV